MFVLNLSFISTPCVLVAAIVVSEMTERLSPNIAPPTTDATRTAIPIPVLFEISAAIGAKTVMVPTLVPIAIEIRHATIKSPGIANPPGTILRSRLAVLAAPPAAFARPPKAPAIKNIKSMMTILSSPIPFAQTFIFLSNESFLFCKNATIKASPKATTTDMT